MAASAGNHAQGLAHHAHRLGIPATIVMPADTPFTKITRTEVHDAEVVLAGDDFAGALATALEFAADTGATFVPAFDDPAIIAGQGTVGLEILDAVPDVDTIVVPVGGGGLVSGIAVAAKAPAARHRRRRRPGRGLRRHGRTRSAADPRHGPSRRSPKASRSPSRGTLTREIVGALVDDLLVVTEQHIEAAVALAAEIEKTVVEGAGAAGLAALVEYPERFRDRNVVVVLTGGNIDLRVLSSVLLRALGPIGSARPPRDRGAPTGPACSRPSPR